MTKDPKRLWIVVLFLGWAYDYLFWEKPVGINFAIFAALSLIGGYYLLVSHGFRPARDSLWLLIPFAAFSAITFIRQEPLTLSLGFTFALVSMALIAVTYQSGKWIIYSLSDFVIQGAMLVRSMFRRPIGFLAQVREQQAESGQPKNNKLMWSLMRGILIALPIVAIFTSLLASADVFFDQKLADFLDNFTFAESVENIFRFVLIVIRAYLLAGIFLHAASQTQDEKLLAEGQSKVKSILGFTESAVVLGSVAALFLVFVSIQFQYFFGGEVNIGLETYSYSKYARRGFNELLVVAIFSLILILSLSAISRRETVKQRRAFSGLSVAIVLQVIMILISAYQRLTLAIEWHGFSRLRLYPRIFLIWLGLLLLAVVVLESLGRERFFGLAALLASLGFSVSLAFVNVDAAIVNYNIARATEFKPLNYSHLATLSTDAVPALVDGYLDSATSAETKEALGATLLCYLRSDQMDRELTEDWQSFNLSRWNAHLAFDAVEVELDEYLVTDKGGKVAVRSPSNELFKCPD